MFLDSVYRVSDIWPLLVNISIYTGRLWDAFMFILCVYIHIYWYMNMETQYMYTLYLHWSYTHLMGPSFAYSSWILFSDSISRLVLRFLLSEHVSLKLNTQQHQQLHQHNDWGAATGHEKQCCDNIKTEGLSWAQQRTHTHLQPRKRKWSHSHVRTSMMMAMGKLKMNQVPKLITFASG